MILPIKMSIIINTNKVLENTSTYLRSRTNLTNDIVDSQILTSHFETEDRFTRSITLIIPKWAVGTLEGQHTAK